MSFRLGPTWELCVDLGRTSSNTGCDQEAAGASDATKDRTGRSDLTHLGNLAGKKYFLAQVSFWQDFVTGKILLLVFKP